MNLPLLRSRSPRKHFLSAFTTTAICLFAGHFSLTETVFSAQEPATRRRTSSQNETVKQKLARVDELFQQDEYRPAIKLLDEILADKKIVKDEKIQAHIYRSQAYDSLEEHALAIRDYDAILKLDPEIIEIYDLRGSEHFKLGHIRESIADFDRTVELRPETEVQHWKRGISYYYAGEFAKGRKQFEGYQTFDDNDVENAVWRFLCMAREDGIKKAQVDILKIKADPRVPMMEIYELYAGRGSEKKVLDAVRRDEPDEEMLNDRTFYAELYLGLYYEVSGNGKQAEEHLRRAEKHRIDHYMWDVARVHLLLLEQAEKKK